MIPFTSHRTVASVILLLVAQPAVFAEYISTSVYLDAQTTVGGTVKIETYDGTGTAGGGLNAGQVRLTFNANSALPPPAPGAIGGLKDIIIYPDITLSPSQITLPPNWSIGTNDGLVVDGAIFLHADPQSTFRSSATVLISGLGADAAPAHFLAHQMSSFSVDWDWTIPVSNPTDQGIADAPEPSTLFLAALGLSVLVGGRTLRRRRFSFSRIADKTDR